MSKFSLLKSIQNSQGSVLVGVVAFTIIMAIAGAGYLVTTGTTVNHEIAALDNDKAFCAAESGLLIATRWLRVEENYISIKNDLITIGDEKPILEIIGINGMTVNVSIKKTDENIYTVMSEATGGVLKYKKILSWDARIAGGDQSMLIDNMTGMIKKGLANIVFDGGVHVNDDIKFFTGGGNNPLYVNGPVTVFDTKTEYPLPGGGDPIGGDPYYNNYQYGVYKDNGKLDLKLFDECFQTTYLHSQPELTAAVSWEEPKHKLDVKDPDKASLEFLPGVSSAVFDDGSGGGGTIPFADGDVFLVLNNQSIKVSGTVKGKCSVITQGAGNITIEDNLVYDGWNWDTDGVIATGNGKIHTVFNFDFDYNYGLSENENMISLVAAGNGNIVLNVPGDDPEYCMSGFFYTQNGFIDLNTLKPNKDVYFVGARNTNTIDSDHWMPGKGLGAYLFDRRMNKDALTQTGINVKITSSDGSGQWLLILNLNWSETNDAIEAI